MATFGGWLRNRDRGLSKRRRLLMALVAVGILASTLTFGYRWFTNSTPVSLSEAIEKFRSESAGMESGGSATGAPSTTAAPAATASGATGTSQPSPTSSIRPSPSSSASSGFDTRPPEPGVYTFDTQGTEQADSLPARNLPSTSQRSVTLTGSQSWASHHFFSDQHEEWYDLTLSSGGTVCPSFRARISFGPFTSDNTLTFDPPVRFSALPPQVGQRWQGTFPGETHGSYSGQTFEHTTMRVGDENLEVWGIQVDMQLEGKISGQVMFRLWVSPKYRLTLKEHYEETESTDGHTYRGNVTITLQSTTPQR